MENMVRIMGGIFFPSFDIFRSSIKINLVELAVDFAKLEYLSVINKGKFGWSQMRILVSLLGLLLTIHQSNLGGNQMWIFLSLLENLSTIHQDKLGWSQRWIFLSLLGYL